MKREEDNLVYYDEEEDMFYTIEWEETGNNDIPHRHYIKTKEKE